MENMRPIKNDADYDMALNAIDRLMGALHRTPRNATSSRRSSL